MAASFLAAAAGLARLLSSGASRFAGIGLKLCPITATLG